MSNLAIFGLALLAVAGFSVLPVIAKKAGSEIPPFTFTAITMSCIAFFSLIGALLYEQNFRLSEITTNQFLTLVIFGVVNFIAFLLMLYVLKQVPAANFQLLMALSPLVTALVAYAVLGENLTVWFFIALPIVFIGLYLALLR